jgi:hypothetical protein
MGLIFIHGAGTSGVAERLLLGIHKFWCPGVLTMADIKEVVVRGSAAGFVQEISAGRHRLTADEPIAAGGADMGPTPYDLILAALGS